jgi:hypothetical protein
MIMLAVTLLQTDGIILAVTLIQAADDNDSSNPAPNRWNNLSSVHAQNS